MVRTVNSDEFAGFIGGTASVVKPLRVPDQCRQFRRTIGDGERFSNDWKAQRRKCGNLIIGHL